MPCPVCLSSLSLFFGVLLIMHQENASIIHQKHKVYRLDVYRPTHGSRVTPLQWHCCRHGACTKASAHANLVSGLAQCPHQVWANTGLFVNSMLVYKQVHFPPGVAGTARVQESVFREANFPHKPCIATLAGCQKRELLQNLFFCKKYHSCGK